MAKICGAKTRGGGLCKKVPMLEKAHCNWHDASTMGGGHPGKAVKGWLGTYRDLIRPDDLPFVTDIKNRVGAVEEELVIARLQLHRTLQAQARADALPDGMEVYETVERDGNEKLAGRCEVKKKLRDYPALINTMLGRIESLEKTRIDLLKAYKAASNKAEEFVFTVNRARKEEGGGDGA